MWAVITALWKAPVRKIEAYPKSVPFHGADFLENLFRRVYCFLLTFLAGYL